MTDAIDQTTQSRALWLAGLTVAACILLLVALTRAPSAEPCDLDARWALACYRWEAAGWPPCSEALPDVRVVLLAPGMALDGEDLRGAWDADTRTVAIREDSCGATDPTTEHEQGHARGLPHGGPAGSVMASPWERTGLAIPAPEAP